MESCYAQILCTVFTMSLLGLGLCMCVIGYVFVKVLLCCPPPQPSGNHMVYICEPPTQPTTGTGVDGVTPTASGRPPPPKDHFGLAVIGLFCSFFFLPLAIMALLKSMEVGKLNVLFTVLLHVLHFINLSLLSKKFI